MMQSPPARGMDKGNGSPEQRREAWLEWMYIHRNVLSAGTSALLGTVAGFPFDSIKTRMQSGGYRSILECGQKTYVEEGVRGFFRGMFMPLITVSFVKTTSFAIYDHTKSTLAFSPSSSSSANHPPWTKAIHHIGLDFSQSNLTNTAILAFLGGSASGTLISVFSCPFELIKIRRQLERLIEREALQGARTNTTPPPPQGRSPSDRFTNTKLLAGGSGYSGSDLHHEDPSSSSSSKTKPRSPKVGSTRTDMGSMKAIKEIVGTRGYGGLYLGFRLHLARDTLGTGLYFLLYDSFKYLMSPSKPRTPAIVDPPTSTLTSFTSGGLCGVLSWILIYPLDTLKSRYQFRLLSHPEQSSDITQDVRKLLRKTQKRDSPIARVGRLYKGLGISMGRSFLIHALYWSMFERFRDAIADVTHHPRSTDREDQ